MQYDDQPIPDEYVTENEQIEVAESQASPRYLAMCDAFDRAAERGGV